MAFVGLAVVLLDMFLENGQCYRHWLGWQPRALLLCLLVTVLVVVALREFYGLARAAGVHPFSPSLYAPCALLFAIRIPLSAFRMPASEFCHLSSVICLPRRSRQA